MTTLCTVTGILHDRQGNPVTNADISLAYPSGVEGGDGLYSPVVIQTTTSGAGAIEQAPVRINHLVGIPTGNTREDWRHSTGVFEVTLET